MATLICSSMASGQLVLPTASSAATAIRAPNHSVQRRAAAFSPCVPKSLGHVKLSFRQRRSDLVLCSADGAISTVTAEPAEAAPAAEEAVEKYPANSKAVVDIETIKNVLPHRYPFLLVDRVIEYNAGKSVVAIKNVTINDNFFPGHFPDRHIMPGVLIVEAMAQTGGILMLNPEVGGSKESFFFAGIDQCRFRKPVVPGDQLRMKVTLKKLNKRFGIAKMRGEAFVDGELVCDVDMVMALGK